MGMKRRLILLLFTILLVFMAGSHGYYFLYGGKYSFIDCIYMTVISLTSVGYGEVLAVTGNVPAQIFTMILITFGMGIILYGLSSLTALLIEGELTGILRKKKMEKEIGKLKNHFIVCGGGETGKPLIAELVKNHETVVLIEQDQNKIDQCRTAIDLLYIAGDATDDQNLIKAGIHNASGILITLPSDKDNLYVTMTARMLNPHLRIVCRMIDERLEAKLKKAGANRVVSPNAIGALRMASEMIRPTVVSFLDEMLRSKQGNLRINEFNITSDSNICGKKISESDLEEKYGLLILGSRRADGEIEFNPPRSCVLENGMTLIVMGSVDSLLKARSTATP